MVVVRPCTLIPGEARILIMFESTFQDGNFFIRTHNGHFGRRRNKTENVAMSSLVKANTECGIVNPLYFPSCRNAERIRTKLRFAVVVVAFV